MNDDGVGGDFAAVEINGQADAALGRDLNAQRACGHLELIGVDQGVGAKGHFPLGLEGIAADSLGVQQSEGDARIPRGRLLLVPPPQAQAADVAGLKNVVAVDGAGELIEGAGDAGAGGIFVVERAIRALVEEVEDLVREIKVDGIGVGAGGRSGLDGSGETRPGAEQEDDPAEEGSGRFSNQ